MNAMCNDTGIYIKKLFKSREIPYSDIRSVVLSNMEYIFTTREGEIINSKCSFFSNAVVLFDAFKKYNIHFKNEDELKRINRVYFMDEVEEQFAQTRRITEEYADNLIRDRLGPEYGIDVRIIEEGEWISMYLRLLKNGELVMDIPEEAKYGFGDIEQYSFDNFVLAFLVEWDGYGKYGVTKEVETRESCEAYLEQSLNYFLENFILIQRM